MDDEELCDELMSLLIAGAESTATTLAWAFDFLLHDPEALERLGSEQAQSDDRLRNVILTPARGTRVVVAGHKRASRSVRLPV